MKATTEADDRTVEFMHALAASDVDVTDISADDSEFSDMTVEAWVPDTDDALDAVVSLAREHGFDFDGVVDGRVRGGVEEVAVLFDIR